MTTPLILFSDHPAANSGLARITRDLATRIHTHLPDTFRVATLGYGSPGSAKLPFPQYHWQKNDYFLPFELPHIVKDFCADDPFILFTIGDIQRFLQIADPSLCVEKGFGNALGDLRRSGRMKLWGYFPIDAHDKDGKLGPQLGHTLSHYDRILVPSQWAQEIVYRTLPEKECPAIPHGIDTATFEPHPRDQARDQFGDLISSVVKWPQGGIEVPDDALWIGIVATNQSRKDWALGIETVAELKKTRSVLLWAHTDAMKREWAILELLSDFGLLGQSVVTIGDLSDEAMSMCYSAMDLTLSIDRGAGFNYPAFESIFSGTPCFALKYGAHSEWMDSPFLIPPLAQRIEGPLNLLRPVSSARAFVNHIDANLRQPLGAPDALDWVNVWPKFEQWLLDGVRP